MKSTIQQNHLTKLFASLFLTFVCIGSTIVFGQQDFNKFKTLQSSGAIPADFTTKTSSKISNDAASGRVNMETPEEENRYLESIHGQIDKLLFSGSVIYGDEISQYVQSIAGKLLKDEPELLASLRFYTIKSNETNALSTDQGIVFVTTGLISQLESEAQLAFVLSHEISHYDQHHVQESYEYYKTNSSDRNRIEKLSTHSKENELEADRLGLKRYHNAGYSESELVPAFDVLMYSYLPFDEVAVPHDYFNTPSLYIPERLFGDRIYGIKAEEDYNDTRSSHPNIKTRKDAIKLAMKEYTDWGSEVYAFGEERFKYIRDVSRFESLRTNIIDLEVSEALYSVFLLEQEYKDSQYLKEIKALAWLSMVQLNSENDLKDFLPSLSSYEGESAIFYNVIRKLKENELNTVALRTVYDLYKANPDDDFLSGVYDRLVKTLAFDKTFKLEQYFNVGFNEAASEAKRKAEIAAADTTKTEVKSKYDKIKQKKNITEDAFDSTAFAFYALPDVISDSAFLAKYKGYKTEADSMISDLTDLFSDIAGLEGLIIETSNGLSDEEVELQKYILVEPTINYYKKKDKTALEMDAEDQKLKAAITASNNKENLDMTVIAQQNMQDIGTDGYNERNVYISFLKEAANYNNIDLFPVDYEALKALNAERGTSDILFTSVSYSFEPRLSPVLLIAGTALVVTIPLTWGVYFPIAMINGQHTSIRTVLFNTQTGSTLSYNYKYAHRHPTAGFLKKYYSNLFKMWKKNG